MKKKKALTNKDIFSDWKNNHFIIAPNYLRPDIKDLNAKHLIILTDISYWTKNLDTLIKWCSENNCKIQGMTIEIPTDIELTLFCLRWT